MKSFRKLLEKIKMKIYKTIKQLNFIKDKRFMMLLS